MDIKIQLWDSNSDADQICDINGDENHDESGLDLNLAYDISNGRWTGDDYNIGDGSGYGRGTVQGGKGMEDCITFDSMGHLWATFGPSSAIFGHFGAILGPSWGDLGLSWCQLGAVLGPRGLPRASRRSNALNTCKHMHSPSVFF